MPKSKVLAVGWVVENRKGFIQKYLIRDREVGQKVAMVFEGEDEVKDLVRKDLGEKVIEVEIRRKNSGSKR